MSATLITGPAHAEASLFIYPTLVVFEGNQRSAEVTIANRGDETGTFEIGWTDMSMTQKGSLLGHDQPTEWSLQPFIRYSPRRATLAPSESQVIKIALRPNETAVEREYYSHMRVVTINSGAPDADAPEDQAPPQAPSVAITARTAIAIPVIWRNSRSEPALAFESVTLDYETNAVAVAVRRDGLLSVRGFLHVLDPDSEGELVALADPIPLIMYPSIERRVVSVPLPEGFSLADLPPGALICFSPDEALTDASAVLASSPIIPAQ